MDIMAKWLLMVRWEKEGQPFGLPTIIKNIVGTSGIVKKLDDGVDVYIRENNGMEIKKAIVHKLVDYSIYFKVTHYEGVFSNNKD